MLPGTETVVPHNASYGVHEDFRMSVKDLYPKDIILSPYTTIKGPSTPMPPIREASALLRAK